MFNNLIFIVIIISFVDFKCYTIIRTQKKPQGEFEMAVKELTEEGDIPHILATFKGTCCKNSPLGSARNCELLVENEEIVGVNIDGDCVVKTELAKRCC